MVKLAGHRMNSASSGYDQRVIGVQDAGSFAEQECTIALLNGRRRSVIQDELRMAPRCQGCCRRVVRFNSDRSMKKVESYLRGIFGFIGVTALEFIAADGIQVGPEHREKALANALEAVSHLHAA